MSAQRQTKKHKMVGWYSPTLLVKMGLRATVSTVIGSVIDNRSVRVALYGTAEVFDHSGVKTETDKANLDKYLWLDYVADLGDGWQSTYGVASVICAPTLKADDVTTRRGALLIMGGDEVYPEPFGDAYEERTIAPWNAAGNLYSRFKTTLYALPGNHDWYDGLNAFSEVFCRGGRASFTTAFDYLTPPQTHSYFAIKLPQKWWLCGIDIQLNKTVDAAQYDFFERLAGKLERGDQLILCAPTPSWIREVEGEEGVSRTLASIRDLLTSKGAEMRLVLTGDLHHYSRYKSTENDRMTLITAGGGGAFLHPTHKLPEQAAIISKDGKRENFEFGACYPDKDISWKHSYKNFGFPLLNPIFCVGLGFVYMMLVWFLITRQTHSFNVGESIFGGLIDAHESIYHTMVLFFATIPKSPEFALVVLIVTGAFVGFNMTKNKLGWLGIGLLHSLAHVMMLAIGFCSMIELMRILPPELRGTILDYLVFFGGVFLFGMVGGGFLFGLFLVLALNIFGWQWTNAFSSLQIADYKNFLRLRISPNGDLTVFAFGIDKTDVEPARAHLIETINITNSHKERTS